MNRPKPIKPFKTLKDEATFWDTHDVSRVFSHPKTSLSHLLAIEPTKKTSVTIRLQASIKKKIETIARKKGINSSTLSRMWLVEKVIEHEKRQ